MGRNRFFSVLAGMLAEQAIRNPVFFKNIVSSDTFVPESPRSLNGCDRLLLPQILKDFPDFDENLVKTYARQALTEKYGNENGFTLYNVVISRYLRTGAQKTVVLQAAFSTKSGIKTLQRRAELHYTYLLSGSSQTVAANCPNCGGALGYGITVCPYCDSRVASVLGNAWKFVEITEN